jgi:hypothetical protein
MAAEEPGTVPTILHDDRVPLAAWVIAAAYVALDLAVSDRYGFQQDELYFLVASHRLAFGYVDQPLAVLLARTSAVARSYLQYVGSASSPAGRVPAHLLEPATSVTGTARLLLLLVGAGLGAASGVLTGVIAAVVSRRLTS